MGNVCQFINVIIARKLINIAPIKKYMIIYVLNYRLYVLLTFDGANMTLVDLSP